MDFKPLRDHILQLAISGQIVPQLDSEPEVKQLGSAPAPEDVPFEIPEKWQWVPLANVCTYIQRGKSPKYSEIKQLPVVAQKCNQWDGLHMESALFIDPATIPSYKPERFLQSNDVLLNSTGTGTLGRVGLYNPAVNPYDQAVADGHVTVIRADQSMILPPFVKYVLTSTAFQTIILAAGSGTTKQQELALSKVKQLVIPLPPLAEQRRIAAIVDDLFAHLEQMEAAYSEFAGPMTEHFRNTALQMAISGKLLPQLDSEPEVKQIGTAPEKVPFAIPEKWKWVELGKLATSVQYGYTASATTEGNAKLLRITDLNNGQVDWSLVPYCEISDQDLAKFKVSVGDIVIARTGGTVGKSFVVEQLDNVSNAVFASYLIRIRLKGDLPVSVGYVKYFLNSPTYWASISCSARGSAQPNVNAKQLASLLIPLPPLAEQRRIVAKLEDLFSGVDKLGSLVAFT